METNNTYQLAEGQTVRFTEEWSEGDNSLYLIIEMRGDRCLIQPIEWRYGDLVGQETVAVDMLEPYFQ